LPSNSSYKMTQHERDASAGASRLCPAESPRADIGSHSKTKAARAYDAFPDQVTSVQRGRARAGEATHRPAIVSAAEDITRLRFGCDRKQAAHGRVKYRCPAAKPTQQVPPRQPIGHLFRQPANSTSNKFAPFSYEVLCQGSIVSLAPSRATKVLVHPRSSSGQQIIRRTSVLQNWG
jgi:hypothetical protein